jgi:nitrogen fixation protein FixH
VTQSLAATRRRFFSRFSNYRWIPWVIVGCFLIVTIVNGLLVYFAAESWPGLTTDHAYNEGLAYNGVIEESEKEAKLGWKLELALAPKSAHGTITIAIAAHDSSSATLDNLHVSGELIRPVEEIPPVPVTFTAQGGGRYLARIDTPRPGQWNVFLVARRGNDVWHGGQRILVPAP